MAAAVPVEVYKVVIFGDGGVGKSSICLRYVTNTFTEDYLPTIEDCYRRDCHLEGRHLQFDILDTAGQEEYAMLRDQWVREGNAFLLVFSLVNSQTFRSIESHRDRILEAQENVIPPMILVGNKADLLTNRQVDSAEAKVLADSWGIPYIETSAKTDQNCEACFHLAAKELVKMHAPPSAKKKRFCTIL